MNGWTLCLGRSVLRAGDVLSALSLYIISKGTSTFVLQLDHTIVFSPQTRDIKMTPENSLTCLLMFNENGSSDCGYYLLKGGVLPNGPNPNFPHAFSSIWKMSAHWAHLGGYTPYKPTKHNSYITTIQTNLNNYFSIITVNMTTVPLTLITSICIISSSTLGFPVIAILLSEHFSLSTYWTHHRQVDVGGIQLHVDLPVNCSLAILVEVLSHLGTHGSETQHTKVLLDKQTCLNIIQLMCVFNIRHDWDKSIQLKLE